LPNAWVTAVTWAGPDWELWFDTEADSMGNYTLNVIGFDDRTYWLHAEYWQDTGVLMGGVDGLSIHSGDTVQVNLVLAPLEISGTISGHVTADGAPFAWSCRFMLGITGPATILKTGPMKTAIMSWV